MNLTKQSQVNPFTASVPILHPPKTSGFSEGTKWKNWLETD